MASSSGTSSESTLPLTSGSDDADDFKQQLHQATTTTTPAADQRRQKRMLSNRESARRSRMRKQKHLDDLTTEVNRLRTENDRLVAAYKSATQQYLTLEADNSLMRAQAVELATRLQSLNDILGYLDVAAAASGGGGGGNFYCYYYADDDNEDHCGKARAEDGPWIWNWNAHHQQQQQQQQQSMMGAGVGMAVAAAAAAAAAAPPHAMAADMLLF